MRLLITATLGSAIAFSAACGTSSTGATVAPTPGEATTFVATVNDTLKRLSIAGAQAGWVAQNFITDDTEAIDARATREVADATARFAKESTRFDKVDVPPD